MRQANRPHDDDGPNALPPPGTGRSVAWNEVPFGPGLSSNGTLGTLIDQGIELAARILYLHCSTVQNGSAPDTGGGGAVALYPTAQIDWGAHGRRHSQLIDVSPGAMIRVPIVCTDLRVTGRLFKEFAAGTSWEQYNTPGPGAEGVPGVGQRFTMSAFACEGTAGENRGPLIRKLAGTIAAAGTTFYPIAAGAYAVRLIADPSKVTEYHIHTLLASGGTRDIVVPVAAGAIIPPAVEIPSGAASIGIVAAAAVAFELDYFLAF